jgi:hypothetical protein
MNFVCLTYSASSGNKKLRSIPIRVGGCHGQTTDRFMLQIFTNLVVEISCLITVQQAIVSDAHPRSTINHDVRVDGMEIELMKIEMGMC